MTKPESVWDYPRPPRLERTAERIRVEFGGVTVADTTGAYRVLETSHPPTIYIPPGDVRADVLEPSAHRSFCERKGMAAYFDIHASDQVAVAAAWCFRTPSPAFAVIRDYVCFYPSKMDACYVGDERVRAQAGDFYGGRITGNIVGAFKGGPGTAGW